MNLQEKFGIAGQWEHSAYWEFSLGPIGAFLQAQEAELLGRLSLSLAGGGNDVFCALYLMDAKRWPDASSTGWMELSRRTYVRKGLFGAANELVFVVGKVVGLEALKKVIAYGWNSAGGESFHVLLGGAAAITAGFQSFVDDVGADDENEKELIRHFPTVLSRDHDGNHLHILSRVVTSQALSTCLREVLNAASGGRSN